MKQLKEGEARDRDKTVGDLFPAPAASRATLPIAARNQFALSSCKEPLALHFVRSSTTNRLVASIR